MKFKSQFLIYCVLTLVSSNPALAQEGTMAQFDHSGDAHVDLPVPDPYSGYNYSYDRWKRRYEKPTGGVANYSADEIERRVSEYVKAENNYVSLCEGKSNMRLFLDCTEPTVRVGNKIMPKSQYHAFLAIGKAVRGPDYLKKVEVLTGLEKKYSKNTINELKDLLGINAPAATYDSPKSSEDVAAGPAETQPF